MPVVEKQLPSAQARELSAALCARLDQVLFVALALVLLGLGARMAIDRAAPPASLVVPVAAMTLSRLLSALAVSPDPAAPCSSGWRDASAPASDDERAAVSAALGGARAAAHRSRSASASTPSWRCPESRPSQLDGQAQPQQERLGPGDGAAEAGRAGTGLPSASTTPSSAARPAAPRRAATAASVKT